MRRERSSADLLLVSGGWNPNLGLWRAIGGGLRYDEERACFVPDGGGPDWLEVAARPRATSPAAPFWFVEAATTPRSSSTSSATRRSPTSAARSRAGSRSVEHVKRATYIGTAIDQGRTSGVVAAEIVNALLGAGPGAQGPTNARPPYTPVSFAALAGPYRGDLLDPIRRTPMHAWHVERGAAFENVGQWKRPWYFPREGESMDARRPARGARGPRTASV